MFNLGIMRLGPATYIYAYTLHVCTYVLTQCELLHLILQDDVFEEAIVDFFETADSNKDGVLDYNDFYAVSHNNWDVS